MQCWAFSELWCPSFSTSSPKGMFLHHGALFLGRGGGSGGCRLAKRQQQSGSENSLALMSWLRISPPLLCSLQKAQWKGSAPKGLEHGSTQNKITLKMAHCLCLDLLSAHCHHRSCFGSWQQQAVVTVSTAGPYTYQREEPCLFYLMHQHPEDCLAPCCMSAASSGKGRHQVSSLFTTSPPPLHVERPAKSLQVWQCESKRLLGPDPVPSSVRVLSCCSRL